MLCTIRLQCVSYLHVDRGLWLVSRARTHDNPTVHFLFISYLTKSEPFIFPLIRLYPPPPHALLHSPSTPRLQSVNRNFNTHLRWSHSQGNVGLSLSQTHHWHDSQPTDTHSGLTACCYWRCLVINKQQTVGGGGGEVSLRGSNKLSPMSGR